jgi:hypothetical protein
MPALTRRQPGAALETWRIDSSWHHGSHRHLLDRIPDPGVRPSTLDAIIVPTARPIDCLREAFRLAGEARCPVLVLCSRSASAAQAADLGWSMGIEVIAVDVQREGGDLPAFATDAFLAREGVLGGSDLSLKRNLGLLLSVAAGWDAVLFLDDDISGIPAPSLPAAAGLLRTYRAVGLDNVGFPDNSVVCHAYREVGGDQETFIGGGAMLAAPPSVRSFFPNVYNEDWFFLLGDGVPFRVAVSGQARQARFDPFAVPERAAAEELGDCLAEGLYWLLDYGLDPRRADPASWGDFLNRRRRLLDDVLRRAADGIDDEGKRSRVCASLRAAQIANSDLNAGMCDEYVRAWTEDLGRWRKRLDRLPRRKGIDKALATLGLAVHTYRS